MIGQTISHYRILSELGSGGMGVVYEAEDTRLGRHVAIKLLTPEACCDPQAMDRFLREARIISSLSHPHICTLHDIGEHDGQQFMVMELLEGESLKSRIGRGALRLDDVLDLGVQIADALDAAHSAGVVHRDVKPANLFVTRRGQIKVLDFGVAKLAQAASSDRPDLALTTAPDEKTTVGSAIGTVAYMSPEQSRGLEIDARSDVFSFGVVLYEMATGKQPFAGPTSAVIFEGILSKSPVAPSQLNANVPPELDRIIAKALEKDRETRYQGAAEIRADLKRLKRETESGRTSAATAVVSAVAPTVPGISSSPPPTAARWKALWVGAPVLAVAIAAVGVFLWQSERAPALTARDTVVLSAFANRTGDSMFDDTLSEALGVQLRQSPFLNLLPDQQVEATLRLMGRDPMTPVTNDVAREICQRTGSKAILGGSIGGLGSSYLVTLRAQDCVSGAILAEEQAQAESKERVIAALGTAASRFRERLGESLASVQRYDVQVEEATTPSLEALKAYSQGMATRRRSGDFESVPFFRRAVELDPNFALAHARLGTVLTNIRQEEEGKKATLRAYELRDKVSERERLYIEARYHTTIERNIEKAIESYRLLIATYPDDYAAYTNVGGLYRGRGEIKEAIASLQESVRVAPDQPLSHTNLGYAYLAGNRPDDARREFEQTLKLQESTGARFGLFTIAVISGDQALADAQIDAMRGRRDEVDFLGLRAQASFYQGRAKEANAFAEEWVRRLQATPGRLTTDGEALVGVALSQIAYGFPETARQTLARFQKLTTVEEGATDEMLIVAGLLQDPAMAATWFDKAVAHIERVSAPEDRGNAVQMMQAWRALAGGNVQEAYALVEPVAQSPKTDAAFVAAELAMRLGRPADAIRFLNSMVERRNLFGLSVLVPLTYATLGRAHAAVGDHAAARAAYEEAFKIWSRADPDLPVLVGARKEYDRLGT